MSIQDDLSVGSIQGRNWGLYGVVAVGLIASLLFVLWWGSRGGVKPVEQERTVSPGGTTFETIPLITTPRGYPPPPPPQVIAPPPPPVVVQKPTVNVTQPAPKAAPPPPPPAAPKAPARKQLGSAFISNEDKEANKILEELKKLDKEGRLLPEAKTRDENEITTEDDRQGLSQQKNQFLASAGGKGDFFIRKPTDPSLDEGLEKRKLVQASTEIQGAMLQGANTDIPGPFFAQVTSPVCDSPTGHYLLIPPGSKFHAIPNNQLSFGQDRIQIAGVRLLFPDGSSQVIGSMPAIDASDGAPGSEGEVDHHLLGLAGAVIGSAIFSIVGQAGQLLQGDDSQSGTNPVIIGGQAAGQQTERAGDKLINKQLNRPNTIRKNRGDRITLLVDKDFLLPVRGLCT